MNKKTLPRILLVLAILLFLFEVLSLDFDNIGQSFKNKFLVLLVPILIGVSMWINLRKITKEENENS